MVTNESYHQGVKVISPRSGFEGSVLGQKKLHIRDQRGRLSPSPLRSREGISDSKQKNFGQKSMDNNAAERKKNYSSRRI